jgi:hypothetical protein
MSMVPTATERSPSSRLFVLHQGLPDAVGIEILFGIGKERLGGRLKQAGSEALADESALAVAAVGVEAVADDRGAVANDVCDDCYERAGHLGEIDVRVGDWRCYGKGYLAYVCDAHADSWI